MEGWHPNKHSQARAAASIRGKAGVTTNQQPVAGTSVEQYDMWLRTTLFLLTWPDSFFVTRPVAGDSAGHEAPLVPEAGTAGVGPFDDTGGQLRGGERACSCESDEVVSSETMLRELIQDLRVGSRVLRRTGRCKRLLPR